jgi:hypothetical protein
MRIDFFRFSSRAVGVFAIIAAGAIASQPASAASSSLQIGGTPATGVTVKLPYLFEPWAQGGDVARRRFSISHKPGWVTFSRSTGRLYGIPQASNVGTYSNIVISVSDGRSRASLPAFSIQVRRAQNTAPTISGTPPGAATVGTAYSFAPVARDADGDKLTFSIGSKPAWLAFDATTGRISGTPATNNVGTYAGITIKVTDGSATATLPAFTITVSSPGATNTPPTITGSPQTSVAVGSAYSFQPTASGAKGATLTFSISNKPAWASFNTQTGLLSGMPAAANVGTTSNIAITVSDGKATAALASFSIAVTQIATGAATLSWNPPTQNTNGTALTNLAGYRIAYGNTAGALTQSVQIANPGLTSYVLGNLSPGTYYFGVKAYTGAGQESTISNIVSKTIN